MERRYYPDPDMGPRFRKSQGRNRQCFSRASSTPCGGWRRSALGCPVGRCAPSCSPPGWFQARPCGRWNASPRAGDGVAAIRKAESTSVALGNTSGKTRRGTGCLRWTSTVHCRGPDLMLRSIELQAVLLPFIIFSLLVIFPITGAQILLQIAVIEFIFPSNCRNC